MRENDRNFLREYHFFSAHYLSTVATLIVSRMRDLRKRMKTPTTTSEDNIRLGDELGHLLAHLHVVNYMQAEATCALLYALVNRKKGIVPSILRFDPQVDAAFLDALEEDKVSLVDFGVEIPVGMAASPERHQADSHLQKRLSHLAGILRNIDVRRAYNKLKHCGIVVRCADLLSSDDKVEGVEADSVYIPTVNSTADKYSPYRLPLTLDGNGIPPEEKYLNDISFFGQLAATLVEHCSGEKG